MINTSKWEKFWCLLSIVKIKLSPCQLRQYLKILYPLVQGCLEKYYLNLIQMKECFFHIFESIVLSQVFSALAIAERQILFMAMVHYLFHQQNSSIAWIGIGRLSLYLPLISFIIISLRKNWWNLVRHLMNYLDHIFHTMAHSIPYVPIPYSSNLSSKTLVKWCINKMVYWHN